MYHRRTQHNRPAAQKLLRRQLAPSVRITVRRGLAAGEIDEALRLPLHGIEDLLGKPHVDVEIALLGRNLLQVMRLARKMDYRVIPIRRERFAARKRIPREECGIRHIVAFCRRDVERMALMPLPDKIPAEIGAYETIRPGNQYLHRTTPQNATAGFGRSLNIFSISLDSGNTITHAVRNMSFTSVQNPKWSRYQSSNAPLYGAITFA